MPTGLTGLLLNAGMQSAGRLERTDDGIESTFAVNHLAHLALVRGLYERLDADAIVCWTASGTHDPRVRAALLFGFRGARYRTAALLAAGEYPDAASQAQAARDAYATSKLCNILMARHFAAIEQGRRTFFAFDPGLMPGTGLARRHSAPMRTVWNHVLPRLVAWMPWASTPERSGAVLGDLMRRGPTAAVNGSYVDYRRQTLAPYITADEAATVGDLIATSDALLAAGGLEPAVRRRAQSN